MSVPLALWQILEHRTGILVLWDQAIIAPDLFASNVWADKRDYIDL